MCLEKFNVFLAQPSPETNAGSKSKPGSDSNNKSSSSSSSSSETLSHDARLWSLLALLLSSPYSDPAAIPTSIITAAATACGNASTLPGACATFQNQSSPCHDVVTRQEALSKQAP
eukprot:1143697-Pelagomonas_calceolata.AAC.3